ncbi:FAD-dependent oxidoreductase [Salipiger sp.]|uniref:FAD-dependent oxidoreductase n=1 Tax=Salipiger sp. TaxID=2078585 RepID=UPI003A96A0B9
MATGTPTDSRTETRRCEILVVGGGLGGVSATLAALRQGAEVILTERLPWLGGQLTAQGVPLDEGPWSESLVHSASYDAFRRGVRAWYRTHKPLTEAARAELRLNPGQGNIGSLCHEPAVAVAVLNAMLAPHVAAGRLTLLHGLAPVGAATDGDLCRAVTFETADGHRTTIEADRIIDATEIGELLPLAGVEHVLGAESRDDTGELHAIDGPADPTDQQAITWGMALSFDPHGDHTIERPADYRTFRDMRLPFWPGPQFDWTVSNHVTHEPLKRPLFAGDSDEPYLFDLWHARRIAWRRNFTEGSYPSDITIANWPQMDYWFRPSVTGDADADAATAEAARQLSLSFLYWMQTEAPRHDGGEGYRGLRPRGDVLGTQDGTAMQAYYREGYRIRAETTVVEQHIGCAARPGAETAERFADSVGIGAYRIDLHPNSLGNRDTVDIDCFPFQIPLGALLPQRVENLLPACKNIGTTRITNGAYRVHPVEWSIGEASGTLAALSLRDGLAPRAYRDGERLARLQSMLGAAGVLLEWPRFGALTPRSRTGYRPPA